MVSVVDCKNYGITNQGNSCKKSNTGKKVGTAVALALPTAASFLPYKTTMKLYSKILPKNSFSLNGLNKITKDVKRPIDLAKQFIKGKGGFEALLNNKYLPKILKSKGGRAAYIVARTAVTLAIWAGVGRLIGAGVDKIINHYRKNEADAAAQKEG